MPLVVHFLNVGHGDCTFIGLPAGRLMIMDINSWPGHAATAWPGRSRCRCGRPGPRNKNCPKTSAGTSCSAACTALVRQLNTHGIQARIAGSAALINLATDLPAAILADLLGLHINIAVRWVKRAKRDWASYLAAHAEVRYTGRAENMARLAYLPCVRGQGPGRNSAGRRPFGTYRDGLAAAAASTRSAA
jgi:hypothetical protein